MSIDLQGKVAVVTGAGGILCSMFSKAIAKCGAKVALLDLNLEMAEKYASEIRAEGFEAKAYKANVLDKAILEEVHGQILNNFGKCDILINGAGGNNARATTTKEYYFPGDKDQEGLATFFSLDQEGVSFLFNLNFLGTLIPTQVFAADMVDKEDPCQIINISSMNAFTPLTKIPAYSGAKAAISNFTQWLAVHFSKVGIRVNAIAPGFFVTAQNQSLLFDQAGEPTSRTKKILDGTPMGRFGEAEELIGTLLFLLDEKAAGFIDGVVLPVDGGFHAYCGV
ncbi:MAG: SDR family oxidoreductase [Lachnospiraceae bacterium]|jgi:NAD(P)-dependent dehydrogenase (short-subunit alcohol dehydrogenase family)|nr:SDR family oxidoreductase [Lachnospiraceae bacterium]